MRRVLFLGIVLALVAAACGSDDQASSGERVLPPPRPAPTLPGVSVEVPVPEVLGEAVPLGIAEGESLTVRALPGADQPVLGEVPASELSLVGEAFETEDGTVWWLINFEILQGWVQPQIAFTGAAEDITSTVSAEVGAETEFANPSELAAAVAAQVGATVGSTDIVEVSTSEVAGQFSVATTIDLIGFEDDSIGGYRLIVSADGRGRGGNAWWLGRVLQQPLCRRGITPEGACL